MQKLPFHEWLIISLLVAVLLMLTFITLLWKRQELPPTATSHEIANEFVQVTISGAVQKPGSYEFKKGVMLKELLALAQPLPEANLDGLRVNSRLRDGQVVKIQIQKWITVHLEGAVEQPGPFKIKQGAFLQDLTDLVAFASNADTDKLQKKRRLKDQEVIVVPVKRERANPGQKKKPVKKGTEGQ